VTGVGFVEFCEKYDPEFDFSDVQEFRQRHVIKALGGSISRAFGRAFGGG